MDEHIEGKIHLLLRDPKTLNHLLYNKYGDVSEEYNNLYLDALIYSKNSHLFTSYKENLIWNFLDEFLKRYYNLDEIVERLPKISNYYKNYLKFFCSPTFRNLKLNDVIQNYCDNRAELYYKKTYKAKKDGDDVNLNIGINTSSNDLSKDDKKKYSMLFNSSIRNNIDHYMLTQTCLKESDSYLISSILTNNIKNDLITKREDSIIKILGSLGEDINDRFMGKLNNKQNKSKPVGIVKKITSNISTTDKTKPEGDGINISSNNQTSSMFKKISINSSNTNKSKSNNITNNFYKKNQSKSQMGKKRISPETLVKTKPSVCSIYKFNPWKKESENKIDPNRVNLNIMKLKNGSMIETQRSKSRKIDNALKYIKKNNSNTECFILSPKSPPLSAKSKLDLIFKKENSISELTKMNIFHQKNISSKISTYIDNSIKFVNETKYSFDRSRNQHISTGKILKNKSIEKDKITKPKSQLQEFLKHNKIVKCKSKKNTEISTRIIKNLLDERSKSKSKSINKFSNEKNLNEKTKRIINLYSKVSK